MDVLFNTSKAPLCSKMPQLTSSGYLQSMINYVKNCVDNDTNKEMIRILTIELTELNSQNLLKPIELGILISIYTIMILIGTCGSILVIYAVIRQPKIRTPRNLFIVNLAISDLVLCLFTQPFNLLRILYWHFNWNLGQVFCKLVALCQAANIFVSTISIIAIALDRLQVIVYPTKYNVQNFGACVIIMMSWLFALFMASPMLVFSSVSVNIIRPNEIVCGSNTIQNDFIRRTKYVYGILTIVFQYCLPLTLVTYAYIRIYLKIKQRKWQTKGPCIKIYVTNSMEVVTSQNKFDHKSKSILETKDLLLQDKLQINNNNKNDNNSLNCISDCNAYLNASDKDISYVGKLSKDSRSNNIFSNPPIPLIKHTSACTIGNTNNNNNNNANNNTTVLLDNQRLKNIHRRQTRTNALLASITIVFVLSWLPLHIFNLVMDQRESLLISSPNKMLTSGKGRTDLLQFELIDSDSSNLTNRSIKSDMRNNKTVGRQLTLINFCCFICVLISACANPILYGWLNDNFRNEFVKIVPLLSHYCVKTKVKEVHTPGRIANNKNEENGGDNGDDDDDDDDGR